MAKMMAVALPVMALGAAAFTGGSSLGLLGAGEAADTAALGATFGPVAEGAAATGVTGVGSSAALDTFGGSLANTIASVGSYAKPLALGLQAGGTAMQVLGAKQQGDQQKQLANFESSELNANADEQNASAEAKMQQQNKETAYVLSNAAAAAAAGGGSVTDPSTQAVMQTIAGQGRLRSLTDMYNGQAAAQADQVKAQATQYGGVLAQSAAQTKMLSAGLNGGASLFEKYADLDED